MPHGWRPKAWPSRGGRDLPISLRKCLRGVRFVGILLVAGWFWGSGVSLASESRTILFFENFERGLTERWVERGFPSIANRNRFSLASEHDGNHYLKVESARSSSAKGVHLTFSPRQCPYVSWRWKVSAVIEAADIARKEGDDAAAKLYVVFAGPSWWNPLDKRILVYLWDNVSPVGSVRPNAWLPDKERMIVLESGTKKVGQWASEQVNLFADFTRAFPGEVPRSVEGLAFLADTDNTQSQVSSGFDDLMITCGSPAHEQSRK